MLTPAASAAPAAAQPQTITQISADANGTTLVISQSLTQPAEADAATPAPVVERSISLPVGHRDWSGAIANHVLWQVKSDVQSARVQLTPEGMGPVDVRIDVDGKQVSVNFTAAHVETRQALEQSVPQLRAMLAGSGLTLGQTSVQQHARQDSPAPGSSSAQRDGAHSSDAAVVSTVLARRGLVDEYA
jgi:flagellar hook-length control protein FliK